MLGLPYFKACSITKLKYFYFIKKLKYTLIKTVQLTYNLPIIV